MAYPIEHILSRAAHACNSGDSQGCTDARTESDECSTSAICNVIVADVAVSVAHQLQSEGILQFSLATAARRSTM